MTISLINTGGLFTRIGAEARLLNALNGVLASTAPAAATTWGSGGPSIEALGTGIDAIAAQYQSTHQELLDGLYTARDGARSSFSSIKSTLQALVQNTAMSMADDDVGLPTLTVVAALQEIIRQMNGSSDSIKKPTVSVTPANGTPTPTGNPVVVASVLGPTGLQLDMVYNEVLDIVCTADSFSGGATVGRENFSLTGDVKKASYLDWNWPTGSGTSNTLAACDAHDQAGANLLTNGDLDTWTSNTPGTWTISTGASLITAELSDIYGTTGKALKITSDGATTVLFKQEVTSLVSARQVLALNAFLHVEGTAPAAGKVRFALVDNSGTVINDDAGSACSYTVDLTQATLQTTYKATGAMTTTELNGASVSGGAGAIIFRLPSNMPTNVWVEVKTTTLITTSAICWIDHMALVTATQAYGTGVGGGPYVAVFSGNTPVVVNDRYKVTVSNAYDSFWVKFLWRIFDLPTLGLQFPVDASNTINENLIS